MGTFLTVGWSEEPNPTPVRLRDALNRVKEYQCEEGLCVSLTCDDTEWSVATFADGLTVWLNLGCDQLGYGYPRHMSGITRDKVFALWELLAAGQLAEIEAEPWRPGHCPDAEPTALTDNGH